MLLEGLSQLISPQAEVPPWYTEKLVPFLKNQEGTSQFPAATPEAGGNVQIGHGFTYDPTTEPRHERWKAEGITPEEAEAQLIGQIQEKEELIKARIGEDVWAGLSSDAKGALLDIQYNVKGGLDNYPKLLESILSGDWGEASKQHQRSFTNKKGERLPLTRRNKAYQRAFIEPNL